jgi:hypothetical protein
MAHKIGVKIWHSGDEYTITSEPFTLHGGEFQYAIDEQGKTIAVVSPEYLERNVAANKAAWHEQQAFFSKLNKLTKV